MMKGLDDVLFPLSIAAVLVFFLWAAMVAPIRSQERIVTKALEVYRLELEAGIKKRKQPGPATAGSAGRSRQNKGA